MEGKITAETIKEAIAKRYCAPEWATFFEVGSGTGAHCRRHADALSMNMYPSRGLSLIGFEVKVSRADLKKELEQPDKAEEIAQFCNEWFLAVPRGLIRDTDEIPAGWGIIEFFAEDNRLIIKKAAQHREAPDFTRNFVAALLRASKKTAAEDFEKSMEPHIEDRVKSRLAGRDWEFQRIKGDYEALKSMVSEFEKATGEEFNHYRGVKGIAERMKIARSYESLLQRYYSVSRIRELMQTFIDETNAILPPEEESA